METENKAESYTIKTPVFEGPFGLLLDLIEKRKLLINDVSLAEVTEEYLRHMRELGRLHHGEISSFVAVASTLLLIKSKSLLPDLELTSEEEGDIKSLEERLRLYELFIRLGGNIKNDFGKRMIFAPEERRTGMVVFLPDERITRDSMMVYVKNVLGAIPKKEWLPEVEVKKVISIEEMIDNLTQRIKNSLKMSFGDFAKHKGMPRSKEEKVFVIVGFLAMLELVREGLIDAMQTNHGEDIIISKLASSDEGLEPRNYNLEPNL